MSLQAQDFEGILSFYLRQYENNIQKHYVKDLLCASYTLGLQKSRKIQWGVCVCVCVCKTEYDINRKALNIHKTWMKYWPESYH